MKDNVIKFIYEFETAFLDIFHADYQIVISSYNSACENGCCCSSKILDVDNSKDLEELISYGMTAKTLCEHYPNSRYVYIAPNGELIYLGKQDIISLITSNSNGIVRHIIACPYIEANKHIYELVIEKLGIRC